MRDAGDTSLFAVDASDGPERRPVPEDASVRGEALDTARSLLVQAPAGAGKTSLLTQRYLALLATVEHPEQILAVTFTRLATAEMRGRILLALEAARECPDPLEGEGAELALARAALRQGEARGWQLLEQPGRLDIQSIDALALRIAHGQPMLARLGGALAPSEYADPLYAAAARRTMRQLDRLGGGQAALQQALGHLLRHRDNHLTKLEGLLADALRTRDAWVRVLPISSCSDTDWEGVRAEFERPFAEEHARVLGALDEAFAAMPAVAAELLALCNYAGGVLCEQGAGDAYSPKAGCPDLRRLRELSTRPGATALSCEMWLCIAEFLLTQGCTWRKKFDKSQGIPPKGDGAGRAEREGWKARAVACVAALQQEPLGDALLQSFAALRVLPAERFSELQWETLRAIFTVLRYAMAALRLVFAEANTVDFTEIALAAEDVLNDPDSMRGLLESEQKQHLLIDEFQDTSRTQFRLIAHLIREWTPGDGRTVFLVGDPLQSIYAFRQAEVALFHQTREHGLPCGQGRHPCASLQLTHNFRSHSGLVDGLNDWFRVMWAEESGPAAGGDTFTAAQAWPLPAQGWNAGAGDSLQLHPAFFSTETESVATAREQEAAAVVAVVQLELLQMQAAIDRGEPEYKIAILFRSRLHLAHILPALRAAGIGYRGVELEPLGEQTEVRDLHLLLRALLHAADRIAWLSVLRAPWCGLALRDLHALTGHDDPEQLRETIPERIAACVRGEAALSHDGRARLTRVWEIVEDALGTRYTAGNNLSLSQWLERTWTALGGPACLASNGHDNADAFFRLLDEVAPAGVSLAEAGSTQSEFALRLRKLYAAPDPRASERFGVQIMSIHKAKGLGFQAVLLPGLERKAKADAGRLLHLLERTRRDGEPGASEVLLCPVGASEGGSNAGDEAAIGDWIKQLEKGRAEAERKRLFYVACTRARLRLHLFACVASKETGLCEPDSTSLLGAAWGALGPELQHRYAEGSQGLGLPGTVALAASAEVPVEAAPEQPPLLLQMGSASEPLNRLDRLPADYRPQSWAGDVAFAAPLQGAPPLFVRAEGSLTARARGTAMHALLQQLAALFAQPPGGSAREEQSKWRARLLQTASYSLRRNGYAAAAVRATANALVEQALAVAETALGQWLFAPYAFSLVEASWQAAGVDGSPQTIRVDRCFVGGDPPGVGASAGEQSLWLIDYKSAVSAPVADPAAMQAWLAEQKLLYQPQLEAYAAIVGKEVERILEGPRSVRCGLYFPEILELLTW